MHAYVCLLSTNLYLFILTLKRHFSKNSFLSKKLVVNVLISCQGSALEIKFFLIIWGVLLNYLSAAASNPVRNAGVIGCYD